MNNLGKEASSEYDASLLADLYGEDIHSPLRRMASQVRHEARRMLVKIPAIYIRLARQKYPPGVLHRPEAFWEDTQIVIEGYPRSGNTFAFTAFDLAQGETSVRVSHHLHTASIVMTAIRRKIPCLILLRNPEDAIISHIIYSQNLTIKQCLKSYIDFYQPLLQYRDRFVTAKFEDVISDFGKVTHEVNLKFGTDFAEFDHNQDNVDKCFNILENSWKDLGLEKQKSVTNAPSEKRKRYKEVLKRHYKADDLENLRDRAFELYRQYI